MSNQDAYVDRPYRPWEMGRKWLRYQWVASNGKGHGIHSPFVFEFVKSVLNDRTRYPVYAEVEVVKSERTKDPKMLSIIDFGAGSVTGNRKQRSVASIARHASKPFKYASLLYRIAGFYGAKHVLELGTSLGFSTAYLSAADVDQVVSLEGDPAIAELARQSLLALGRKSVDIVTGNIDETLQPALQTLGQVDLVFMDGNHRYAPTMRYFETILPFLHTHSLVIVDDIHWSPGMEAAWHDLQQHPAVTLSIDLFFIGILCFRKDFKVKQHFTIRY